MKIIASIVLSVIFLAPGIASAKDAPKANPYGASLAAAPAAELPAKAADLVAHTRARERVAATIEVVKAAVAINPAAAPATVGAIARAVPAVAHIAAGTAAAEQPKQASAIAKAAAAAAPSKAGKIVIAVCRAVPNDYRNIAIAVSQAAPTSGKEIVKAVAAALPELKPCIEKTLAAYSGTVVSVAGTLDQVAIMSQTTTVASGSKSPTTSPNVPMGLSRGPSVGPPYLPITSTPINVTPGTSGEVPEGGRNYAQP